MVANVDALRNALLDAPESDYVRIVAMWLQRGTTAGSEEPTGDALVDALVAAAVAHVSRAHGLPAPEWAAAERTALASFWNPGGDRFFAYSLAHAPAEFAIRGLIIEADSLVSV